MAANIGIDNYNGAFSSSAVSSSSFGKFLNALSVYTIHGTSVVVQPQGMTNYKKLELKVYDDKDVDGKLIDFTLPTVENVIVIGDTDLEKRQAIYSMYSDATYAAISVLQSFPENTKSKSSFSPQQSMQVYNAFVGALYSNYIGIHDDIKDSGASTKTPNNQQYRDWTMAGAFIVSDLANNFNDGKATTITIKPLLDGIGESSGADTATPTGDSTCAKT